MAYVADHARPMACPACVVGAEVNVDDIASADGDIILALPTIHCAACISGVERALEGIGGVRRARVNLTLHRVAVRASGDVTADDLIATLAAAGYPAQELDASLLERNGSDDRGRALLMRLGVAGFAMMNVMLLSVAVWSGADAATRDMMHWISAAITLPAIAFCGQPFFVSAWSALRGRRLNMDVPIVLAILLAAGTSLYETMLSGEHAYFDAAITLTFFLLGGRYLDHQTRASAQSAAQELAALEVHRAIKIVGGTEVVVPAGELAVGDIVRVLPGARFPVDGTIISGTSEVDTSFLTGESLPAFAGQGAVVHAGAINLTGALEVEVTAAGADTSLRQIADLVALAESGRARYTSLADQAAKLYAPGVHILSVLAAVGWFLYTYDLRVSLNIAAAVLIITCPCALGLAVPAVTTAASGRLYAKGLLVKHETALERLAEVDVVAFDKTGTLTEGAPRPTNLDILTAHEAELVLALAQGSAHPLSQALVAALRARCVTPAAVTDVHEVPGYGVEAMSEAGPVRLGRAAWVGAEAVSQTASYLQVQGQSPVALEFEDTLRAGAKAAIDGLHARGIDVVIVSGDGAAPVARLAETLGVRTTYAGVLPHEKAQKIEALAAQGKRVLMVGDGLNDTAALASAHVSMSPASALDAARVASDVVLVQPDLSILPEVLDLACQARKRISENFTLATVYNVVAVPLAIAGMATPLIAAIAMSSSSLTVSLNALRLRR